MQLAQPDSYTEAASGPERRGVTVRAVAIGLGVALFIQGWGIFSSRVIRSSGVTAGFLSPALFIGILLVLFILNPFLKRVVRSAGLSLAEILTIFAMGLMGGAPIAALYAFITIPYDLATPENQWGALLHPHLPSWVAPLDVDGAVTLLFNGLPGGQGAIPWGAWIIPMFWWVLLFCVLAFAAASLSVILRKQWVEHERLRYPVLEPIVEMASGSETGGLWPQFARGKLFWFGAGFAFVFIFWNALPWVSPAFPEMPVRGRVYAFFGRDMPPMFSYIDPFTFAFSYFANLDVLFSVWFFFAVFVLEFGIFNRLGYSIGGRGDRYGSYDAASSWQGLGAFCVFVLFGLWMARRHLKDVVMKAWRSDASVDDSREMLSYRTAVVGILVGFVFTVVWLNRAGMDLQMAIPLVAMLFILYIGVARIIAESGLLYVQGPMTAQSFSVYLLGAKAVSPSSLTTLLFSYPIHANSTSQMSHVAKVGEQVRDRGRRLFWAVGLSFLATTLVVIIGTLYLGYTRGAENFGHGFICGGVHNFPDTVSKIKEPFDVDWNRIMFFGIGAAVMVVLTFLRYRFPWWPIHPVGFAIMGTDLVRNFALTLFLAWSCKTVILRVGGNSLFRQAQPFFLGLLVGHVLGITGAFLVDMFMFPGAGHSIHPWIE